MHINDLEGVLEVTITHNLGKDAKTPKEQEIQQRKTRRLFEKRLIALDWDAKGSFDPEDYKQHPTARTQFDLFAKMKNEGAAVIAAYKGAVQSPSDRLIGRVEQGTKFVEFEELLCLPLTDVREVDSSLSFLGNLPPRQCTLQTCHTRARGRLAALVLGNKLPRDVWQLHNKDVELLVTNYLIAVLGCKCIWKGTQSFEDIDHIGLLNGCELVAQTTVSKGLVKKKAEILTKHKSANRELHFFGPSESAEQCPKGITYHAIEEVFNAMARLPEGKWLIDRLLAPQQTKQARAQ